MVRTKSIIWSRASAGGLMMMSMPVAEHVEVEIGDQRCDLDQRIGAEVEAGHLAVDPDQSLVHEGHPTP